MVAWSALASNIGGALSKVGGKIVNGASKIFQSEGGLKFLGGLGQGAGTGALNAIGNLFGGNGNSSARAAAEQYNYNLALQKQQQEWNEYMYRNRYQMQVEDLEKAGINKLYGLGTAPSVTSGLNSTSMADYVGEQNNKVQQFLHSLEVGQNLSARRAETKLIQQQTDTERINTNLKILEQTGVILDNQYKKLQNENLPRAQKIEAMNIISNTTKNMTSAQKDIQETQKQQIENSRLKRIEDWHKAHPGWSGFATGVGELSNAITTGLALGAGGVGMAKAVQANKTARKLNYASRR